MKRYIGPNRGRGEIAPLPILLGQRVETELDRLVEQQPGVVKDRVVGIRPDVVACQSCDLNVDKVGYSRGSRQ